MKTLPLCALTSLLLVSRAFADVRLPTLVGDHMVLQQNDDVRIWGWADAGEEVLVMASWVDKAGRATADKDGKWSVTMSTGPAGGPHTLTIRGNNEIVLADVLLGEVWVCGGQSNMEWPLERFPADLAAAQAQGIPDRMRMFTVDRRFTSLPREDCKGNWSVCGANNIGEFSAVGFYFGRELASELDVPIGLISCNWGGTVAEAWTSESTLRRWPAFETRLDRMRENAANPGEAEKRQAVALQSWWDGLAQRDTGTREGWEQLDFDDSAWDVMQVPNNWSETPLGSFDGMVWMRCEFDGPAEWAGEAAMLELGPIDDMDTTWLNGVRVGGLQVAGSWQTDRHYAVPAGVLRAGRNVIAVRVYDSGGAGGLAGKAEQITLGPLLISRPLQLAGEWKYAASTPAAQLAPWPQTETIHQNYPTALYNGMLSPVLNYAMRGAIWYQGESNVGRAEQYEELFPAMIANWRAAWGRGDFPFYFAQIAPFAYGGDTGQAAALRDAQRLSLRTPNTGMAVLMDIGDPGNIHPAHKDEVGRRLALWALAKTYAQDIPVWCGPSYASISIEQNALRVHFEPSASALQVRGDGPLSHFELAGADGVFHAAEARIDGDTLLVRSDQVASPLVVRFAWGAADRPNLMNAAGLPASSFQSDNE